MHGVGQVVGGGRGEPGRDGPELIAGQGGEQVPLGGEVAVEGGFRHRGPLGHGRHGDVQRALLVDQRGESLDDALLGNRSLGLAEGGP
jgi:hypothetical protein